MFRLLRVSPPHGWHAVWWELGIVTLGVLIALAAEQAVQELHWRQQTKATTDALSNEVATSAADAVERVAVEDCLRSRIRDLTRELNRSDGKWTANPLKLGPARNVARVMPSIPPVYRAPGRDWNEDVWEAAKSTGMINHLRRDRTASYSQVYAIIRGLRMLQQDEAALAPKLAFLSFDQQLDNQSRVNALMILGELDMVNAQIGLASRNLANQAKELRLNYDRQALARSTQETFLAQRRLRGTCVKEIRLDF